MIVCTCDLPTPPDLGLNEDRPESHNLTSHCYVWYLLKCKYRGSKNVQPIIERVGDDYVLVKDI